MSQVSDRTSPPPWKTMSCVVGRYAGMRLLRCDFENFLQRYISRGPSDHDLELAWHHSPVHVDIEQLEIFRDKFQCDRLSFSGIERHSLETSELLDGP